MLKLNLYNITNGAIKVRVHYSENITREGKPFVTIRAKEYGKNGFDTLFGARAINDSESREDYFEFSRVNLFEHDELYTIALKHVKTLQAKFKRK